MTLDEICSLLVRESSDREREAINLFIEARQGKQVDGKRINTLSGEALKLGKALEILRKP